MRKRGKGKGSDKQPPKLRLLVNEPTSAKGPGSEKPPLLREAGLSRLAPTFRLMELVMLFHDRQKDYAEGKCTASELETVVDAILYVLSKIRQQEEADYARWVGNSSDGRIRPRLLDEANEAIKENLESLMKTTDGMIEMYQAHKASLKKES